MRHTVKLGLLGLLVACNGGSGTPTTGEPGSSSSSETGTTNATPTTGDPQPTSGTVPTTTTPDPTSGTTAGSGDDTTSDTTTGEPAACGAVVTFADGKQPTAELHVATDGADGPTCGAVDAPCGSIEFAAGLAAPGTAVRIHSGTYAPDQYISDLAGTADAPIWISGEPGAKIGPLTLESASHIVVSDLEIAGSDGHVLHFFFADHLLFRRLKIHDAGLGCIKGSQTTAAYVEDSELWAAGQVNAHPILDYVGVNTGHIVRSDFHDGPGVMIMLKGGTSDLLFAWNQVHQQSSPGNALALGQSTGPEFFQPIDAAFEGLRIVAFANRLYDLVGAPVAFEGCKDCAAVRNTIWNCTGPQLVRFLPGAAGIDSGLTTSIPEGCRFTGNIVVGGQEGGASLNADEANTGPGNSLDYNVFLKPGSLNWWGIIPQDLLHSTYDQDPQLSAEGVPANLALVDGKGPPDLAGLPFADLFVRDAAGACLQQPPDLGAFEVP